MRRDSLGRITLPSNDAVDDTPTTPNVAVPRSPAYVAADHYTGPPAFSFAPLKPAKSDTPTLVLITSLQWFYIVGTLLVAATLVVRIVWEVLFMRFQ